MGVMLVLGTHSATCIHSRKAAKAVLGCGCISSSHCQHL